MRVIKESKVVEDNWTLVREIESIADCPAGDVIVPFAFWQENRESLLANNYRHAIWIDGDIETEAVVDDLSHFDLIALDFPAFKDGRSYSHARLLKERYGFNGELRAIGDVLRDQLFFMQRCGIDSYELRHDKDPEEALAGFKDFSVRYQTAADGALPIYKVR